MAASDLTTEGEMVPMDTAVAATVLTGKSLVDSQADRTAG